MKLHFWTASVLLAIGSTAGAQTVILNEDFSADAPLQSPPTGWGYDEYNNCSTSAGLLIKDVVDAKDCSGNPIITGSSLSGGNSLGKYREDKTCEINNTWDYRELSGLCPSHHYRLTAYYAGSFLCATFPTDYTARWQIGLLPGAYVYASVKDDTGTITAAQTAYDYTTLPAGSHFGWTAVSYDFQPTESTYTVFLRFAVTHGGSGSSQYNHRISAYFDDIKVVDLDAGMAVSDILPAIAKAGSAQQFTISGGGLMGATRVTLTNGTASVSSTSFDSKTNNQIKVTLTLPANAPGNLGSYDLQVFGGTCGTITQTGAVTVYSGATGLLVNGDFETGDLTGWTSYGDATSNAAYDTPTGTPNFPTTPSAYGNYGYRVGSSIASSDGAGIYQYVQLTPSQNYALAFKLYAYAEGGVHEVGVFPGQTGGTFDLHLALNYVQRTSTTPDQAWESVTLPFTAPPGGWVTVYVKGSGNPKWATKTDDMSLTTDGTTCPNPFYITSVTPNPFGAQSFPATQTFTVNGAGFDTVSSVALTGAASVSPTSWSKTATQVTATFNIPTDGDYYLTLTRPAVTNCKQATTTAPLQVNCGVQTPSIDTPAGGWIFPRGSSVTIDITGDHLVNGDPAHPFLQGVQLVKSYSSLAVINATGLTVADDTHATATFNLSAAEAGRYDLMPVWRTGLCNTVTPKAVRRQMLVYLPDLANTGFENGYDASAPTTNRCVSGLDWLVAPQHWDVQGGPTDILTGSFQRDGNQSCPACLTDNTITNLSQYHYASLSTSGITDGKRMVMFQTIAAPSTAQAMDYRADLHVQSGARLATGKIILRDGTEYGTIIAQSDDIPDVSTVAGAQNGFAAVEGYKATLPQGYAFTSNPATLTVIFQIATTSVIADSVGLHVDHVYRGGFVQPGCNRPWADLNGDTFVDMLDFAVLQTCLTQGDPNLTPNSDVCRCADQTGDGHVTDADVNSFIYCASGPRVPWSPSGSCP